LSTKSGAFAYQQAIRGNLLVAQEMGSKKYRGINVLSDSEFAAISRMSKTYIGLPIFFNRSSAAGSTQIEEKVYSFQTKTRQQYNFTEYSRTVATGGILSKHFLDKDSFSTKASADLSEIDMTLIWSTERESSSAARIQSWARQLDFVMQT